MPALNTLDADAVASSVTQRALDRARALALLTGHHLAGGAALEASDLYHSVRDLVRWAQTGQGFDYPSEAHDALTDLCDALYGTAIGGGTVRPLKAAERDPEEPADVVILAAWARLGVLGVPERRPLELKELAALAGLTYDAVAKHRSRGTLVEGRSGVDAREARRWLHERGVEGLDPA